MSRADSAGWLPSPSVPRLFGTDGVRGVAGRPPLDPPAVRRLGAALVRVLKVNGTPRLLLGRDTRESGHWIEAEFAHGANGEGADVETAGIVPTPAIAYLTEEEGYDAGVVISASHNPFGDNGIKVFTGRGVKLAESDERRIEAVVADTSWQASQGGTGPVLRSDLIDRYVEHLATILPEGMGQQDFLLGVDCANGATTPVAPKLFAALGLRTTTLCDQPDGRNINLDCGSTHPRRLAELVMRRGCRMGVAFDGDGDRAIFVDERGRVVDGDTVLLICGRQLQQEGRLRGNAIVATVMSNIGLELALRDLGISLVRCAVGDKYVMEEMQARGLSLGGEQSGHVIFADYLSTGDGLCTTLNVLRILRLTGRSLGDLAAGLVTYPQVLLNVRVKEKIDLDRVPEISAEIAAVEAKLQDRGRLLVRYSGTEPLLRVMIEGQREDEIHALARGLADVVSAHLG